MVPSLLWISLAKCLKGSLIDPMLRHHSHDDCAEAL